MVNVHVHDEILLLTDPDNRLERDAGDDASANKPRDNESERGAS